MKVRLFDIKSSILSESVQGNLSAKSYEIGSLHLQSSLETAVQTHQLFSKSNLLDMEYNCIEVFQKEEDSNYYASRSIWSILHPMEKDFSNFKDIFECCVNDKNALIL